MTFEEKSDTLIEAIALVAQALEIEPRDFCKIMVECAEAAMETFIDQYGVMPDATIQ